VLVHRITRRWVLGVVALVFAAAGGSASAAVPTQDTVTGTGSIIGGASTFTFDVHSGPSGENPTGTITVKPSERLSRSR